MTTRRGVNRNISGSSSTATATCTSLFKRPDLVAKANKIVADYYGEVLPDGRRSAA